MTKKRKPKSKPVDPRSEELNRLVRTAALTLDPLARLGPLAERSGQTIPGIRAAIRRGYFSAGAACALEMAVGRDLLKREKLCPHKFGK